MNIEQLHWGVVHRFWLASTDDGPFEPGLAKARAAAIWKDENSSSILLGQGKATHEVREGSITSGKLEDLCTANLPRLAWIAGLRPEEPASRALLVVHQFPGEFPFPMMDIAVDEKIIEQVKVFPSDVKTPRKVIECLSDQCLLAGEGESTRHAFLSAGDGEPGAEPPAFVLHGRSLKVFVRRVRRKAPDGSEVEMLAVDKVTRSGRPTDGHPVYLASGRIAFVDGTVAGRWASSTRASLTALVESDRSFLKVWHHYGEMERSYIARRVKAVGSLAYSSFEFIPEGVRFDLDGDGVAEKLAQVQSGETFEATAGEPDLEALFAPDAPRPPRPPFVGAAASRPDPASSSLILKADGRDQVPPDSGFLAISALGDRTRLERRDRAQATIREASGPMPQLGLLLEGADVAPARHTRIRPLSPTVIEKVFTDSKGRVGPPNPIQEDAIALALNTPDIALIQGPPGTGKTTVIRAVIERLNELIDPAEPSTGTFLLSGFQHDAVDNAIARLDVNQLPPIKFGRRNGVDGLAEAEGRIDRWRARTAEKIAGRFGAADRSAVQKQVRNLVNAYVLAPGDARQAAGVIDRVLDLALERPSTDRPASIDPGPKRGPGRAETVRAILSDALLGRAQAVRRRLVGDGDDDEGLDDFRRLVRSIRGLRSEPGAFADDGPMTALRVKTRLERLGALDGEAGDLLDRAVGWDDPSDPPGFLEDLAGLRRRLLRAYVPRCRRDRRPGVRRDVAELLAAIQDALELAYRRSMDGIDEATAEYHALLENNPDAVKRAVIDYTPVYAATCQGAARKELADVKGADNLIYDTVLVDEAARSNPLDLFIPLTQARRRIILVGDHRQLPHIIDSEIERELEQAVVREGDESVAELTDRVIRESLFQRLFALMKRREETDKIRRTITLNVQYRMHPKLGQFVSTQFYPADEQFGSGRPAEDFPLDLPGYEGRTAAWIDVPAVEGPDRQDSKKSRSRVPEAEAIASEVARLIRSPASEEDKRTFGVITFYKAQEVEIKRALVLEGLMVADDEGDCRVAEPYRDGERLRVGTVDAFQGKEFDVVFLSMVRSNRLPDGDEVGRRRKYGHLMSPNRMCVSMSRQKQLLIVVGDAGMLRFPRAAEAIGPLVAFHALALSEEPIGAGEGGTP